MPRTLTRSMRHAVVSVLLIFLGPAVYAQAPSADWRTVETPHFRVHYPVEYEEWSLRAAERLESIREEVSKEVGFTPPQTIDVIVTNPVALPNGIAWPLLDTPRMIFFAEPPGPDEQLGLYAQWIDLLAVHETAHLVHMLRPSRNPMERLLEKSVLPFNPITLRAPRWVLEGYATVIEGRLTGAGRPNSTIRALILRRLAQSGRLPTYGQLNSGRRFLDMSMAYLMGSAYLEWLEQRSGPESLRSLWSRLTARQRRSFSEAFTGVFGERPDRLYGRFVAELTASSMAIDRATVLQEGELFQETPRASGSPAVSPDGTKIAVVIRERDEPEKLVIWSTEPPDAEEKKFEERLKKILARDPEDVAPVRAKPLPRKAIHSLTMPDGGDIDAPRWTRDGKSIVFSHRVPDGNGFLHWDLFRWDFANLTRITHLADVRDADPFPDGRTAIAVRNRFGASELVSVSLTTGAVTSRTEPSIDVVRTHPRVSPDGTRVAHVAHREGRWTLFLDDIGVWVDGDAATPEWLSDHTLVVTAFSRGFAELHLVRSDSYFSMPVTRTAGGAFEPAPASDGRVFFMSLTPDGYVVRVLPSVTPVPDLPAMDASLIPAIPPFPAERRLFASRPTGERRPYGLGRQELSWFLGSNHAPGQSAVEFGLRLGDVIGRLDTLLIGSNEGVALASAWRGWPVELGVHAFTSDDFDDGIELRAAWSRRFPCSTLALDAGALSDDVLFGSVTFSTRQFLGASRFEEAVRVAIDDEHYRAIASASFRSGSFRLAARYQRDGGNTVALGGLPLSIVPRSVYARRILDPSLPVAILGGEEYDGWRVETTVPSMPFTVFYQRHQLDGAELSLAGAEIALHAGPNPVLKIPGLDFTIGAAYVFDEPLRGETKWWAGMRWHP